MRRAPGTAPEVGERFGSLTVIGVRTDPAIRRIRCRCDCGAEPFVLIYRLYGGLTKSCGCGVARATAQRSFKHGSGYSDYRYTLWRSIKKRCLSPGYKDYEFYGGRGISMYEPWRHDFPAFARYLDTVLGERPEGLTLDRINNDGHYEPGNLRWATRGEQARNRWRSLPRV
jgi:hypothetical protein